jgi:tRNA G18 (ribose-2'-O)-methylase SpoU
VRDELPPAADRVIRVTSLDDPRIAHYREVANPAAILRAGLFVAEGRWVVERLLARSQYVIRSVLMTPTAFAAMAGKSATRTRLTNVPTFVVDPSVMTQVVGYDIHRGCLALAERSRVRTLDEVSLDGVRRAVVLEGVNNPDNVGGIFRSAAAFAIDLVVLGPGCGDPLYRKAIRTSMAATLDVPYVTAERWPDALGHLRDSGLVTLALTPSPDAAPLETLSREIDRVALLLGTEGAGLTPSALAAADRLIRIHTTNRVDSLNVTVAASIAMHYFSARLTA